MMALGEAGHSQSISSVHRHDNMLPGKTADWYSFLAQGHHGSQPGIILDICPSSPDMQSQTRYSQQQPLFSALFTYGM